MIFYSKRMSSRKRLRFAIVLLLGVATEGWGDDSPDACGAILCLAAGPSGGVECATYLARFFSIIGIDPADTVTQRRHFLSQCEGADVGNFPDLAASYSQSCQPDVLTQTLNAQAAALQAQREACYREMENRSEDLDCEQYAPSGNETQALCGPWYSNEMITYRPPYLTTQCTDVLIFGTYRKRCDYEWHFNTN